MTAPGPFDRLPSSTRRRLEAFTSKVDRVGFDELPIYAVRPSGPDHQQARDNAERIATEVGRQDAVTAARRMAVEYIERRFAQGSFRLTFGQPNFPGVSSAEDRVNLAVSFEEAITAIILADVLDEAERDELIGPWANLIET